jgi:uncharacterized protein YecE (DUF72 family)
LHKDVRFGTSSWSFPGWGGIVFPEKCTKTFLARDGLPLYVRHPLLRTVGIDRGYYAPIPVEDLRRYASQLPERFPTVAKAPGIYTTPFHTGHGGAPKGSPNPAFLDAKSFTDTVARPFLSDFRDHTAAIVLEFPPMPPSVRLHADAFASRLDSFLEEIPSELPCCVELRNPELLTPAYAQVLTHRRVAHVFNYWTAMPMPLDQLPIAPLDSAPFVVLRLMLRPGTRYEDRKAAFAPFDRIVDPDPRMHEEVLSLAEMARALRKVVLVLVNNKAEGSAPLTIEHLARRMLATGCSGTA